MSAPAFDAVSATTVRRGQRELIAFAGCNYLGLAHEPRVLRAASEAMGHFGLSTSASRETSGNTALHEQMEDLICAVLGAERALLVPDGYTANLAAMQMLAAVGVRTALVDERSHRSLLDAARCAGMDVRMFRGDRFEEAQREIQATTTGDIAILTDGVFASDGRMAMLRAFHESGLYLVVDDCHAFGVLGPGGAGTLAHQGLGLRERVVVTSTLAKGIGCAGGFVAARASLIDVARVRASAYVCTTPASPVLIAGAIEALSIARVDDARHERLRTNIEHVESVLRGLGITVRREPTPIFAFTIGSAQRMERIEQVLEAEGVFVPVVTYPSGPSPVYFRLSVTSEHEAHHIDTLARALQRALSAGEDLSVPSVHARHRSEIDA